ncbi:hypothetical protein NXW19_27600 [Bacteroides ovatus]|nr:hypothetical protein NXW19_27600 [Bacteroides ovatus]
MKKILLKYLNLYVLSGLLLVGFAGCSDDKDNDPVNPGPDVEELPSIGTYSFRGKRTGSCPVRLLWTVVILPVSFLRKRYRTGKTSTYFLFSLGMYWEGQVVDASTLYQNDQYFFIYEDPFYYYSQYKRVTGTFYVKRNNDENVTVKLNLRLHDGVRFKAEVTADLMKPSGEGTPE